MAACDDPAWLREPLVWRAALAWRVAQHRAFFRREQRWRAVLVAPPRPFKWPLPEERMYVNMDEYRQTSRDD